MSDVSSTWLTDLPLASKSNCSPSKHLKARQQNSTDFESLPWKAWAMALKYLLKPPQVFVLCYRKLVHHTQFKLAFSMRTLRKNSSNLSTHATAFLFRTKYRTLGKDWSWKKKSPDKSHFQY